MKKQETYRFDSDDMLYQPKNSEEYRRGRVKYKNRNKMKDETRKILKEYKL